MNCISLHYKVILFVLVTLFNIILFSVFLLTISLTLTGWKKGELMYLRRNDYEALYRFVWLFVCFCILK